MQILPRKFETKFANFYSSAVVFEIWAVNIALIKGIVLFCFN